MQGLQPYGFMENGVWTPVGINPCIRITKYNEGDQFSKHRDGKYVKNDDLQSILTLMIYLNDDFEMGTTLFHDLELSETYKSSGTTHHYIRNMEIVPEAGMAVIFKHEMEHSGTKVSNKYDDSHWYHNVETYPKTYHKNKRLELRTARKLQEESQKSQKSKEYQESQESQSSQSTNSPQTKRNIKYIMRLDIMFQRLDDFYLTKTYHLEAEYQLAEKYYWDSIKLQKQGKPTESTEAYLKAQEIQHKFSKKIKNKNNNNQDNNNNNNQDNNKLQLPLELMAKVFGTYMDKKTYNNCKGVCRDWSDQLDHNSVWREKYLKNWPLTDLYMTSELYTGKKNKSNDDDDNTNNDDDNTTNNDDKTTYNNDDEDDDRVSVTNSLMLPTNITINWKSAYQYREWADSNFRPTVIMIGEENTYYKMWDVQVIKCPTVIRFSCGHMWCEGSGSEQCLVGHEAVLRGADDYFDRETIGLIKKSGDNTYNSMYSMNGIEEDSNINWVVVRAMIKDILKNPMLRETDTVKVHDELHHRDLKISKNRRPLVIVRMPWMTDHILECLEQFTIGELSFPYVWIVDFNDLSMIEHEPLRRALGSIDITNQESATRNLQQIWELSQIPEALSCFKTISTKIDWTNYF
jgi:hypothetical protein